MKRKKRKLKKNVKRVLVCFIIILLVILCYYLFLKDSNLFSNINNKENNNGNVIINEIINKIDDDNIDAAFLKWLDNKYGSDVLTSLNKKIDESNYNKDIWHDIVGDSYNVLLDLYKGNYENMPNVKVLDKKDKSILSFVGDVSLADNWYIMPKYDERGKKIFGILSEDTVKMMVDSDLMIVNNEFTISNRGEKMEGKYYTFRAAPERLNIYKEMGVDLVTLANNHVYDFGKDAFYDMLDSLEEYEIPYIGAGRNINEAMRAYYFIVNGYKISFVNATRAEKLILTPEATDEDGGVFRCYDTTNFVNVIKKEKETSDYVIALIHYGREDSHELEDVQISSSYEYIEAGADVIVGSHAHVLQGIEFYKNKPIIYNLGDFIFNNETKDTGIFQIKLDKSGKMSYYFIPALESGEYTKLLDGDEKLDVIKKMNSWSVNAIINEDGKIEEK